MSRPSRRSMWGRQVFCVYGNASSSRVHDPPPASVPVLLLYLFSVLLELVLDAGPGRDALHVLPRVGEGLHHLVAPLEGGAVTDGEVKDASDEPLETLRTYSMGDFDVDSCVRVREIIGAAFLLLKKLSIIGENGEEK